MCTQDAEPSSYPPCFAASGIQMRAPSKGWVEQEGKEREWMQGITEGLLHLRIYCHALFIYFVVPWGLLSKYLQGTQSCYGDAGHPEYDRTRSVEQTANRSGCRASLVQSTCA